MRSTIAAVALLVLLTAPAVLGLAEAPPSIFLGVEPPSPTIAVGGSSNLTVSVYPQGKWSVGHISYFNVTNLPKGVTATFDPGKIDGIPTNGVASTQMTIKAAPDASQGAVVLTVFAFGREDQEGVNLNASIEVPLKIAPAITTTINTTSTTKTSTNTTTKTTTLPSNTTFTIATKTNLTTITLTTTSYNTVTSLATGSRSTYAGVFQPIPAPDPTIPIAAFIIVLILIAIAFLAFRGKIG